MTDTTTTPPAAVAPRTRGYFNQGQLEDIDTAESVVATARGFAIQMEEQDITSAWLDGCQAAITEARGRASATGQGGEGSKQATAAANLAAEVLHTALRRIQSSAKQKHQMLAEDGDPTTNFPTDGYLIGSRLNGNRANLIQSATTLIARAKEDSLPGFKTPEKIQVVEDLLAIYQVTESGQSDATRDKELARLDRDSLIHVINSRRASIQHAADALWPASDDTNRPIRKTFHLPLSRALGA